MNEDCRKMSLQGCPQELYNKIEDCQKQSNLVYISLKSVVSLKELVTKK